MALTRDTEIRKLTSNDLFPLYNILKPERSWTKLMKLIPKVLEPNGVVETNSLPKYSATDINSVKDAGDKAENGAFEVLVDEWGTSGRIRPTIGHLLNLLNKAQLLSAVAYIYETLLNEPAPQPPSTGPARHIEIPPGLETTEIIEMVEEFTYPGSSAIGAGAVACQNLDVNKDFYDKIGCDKPHKMDDRAQEAQSKSNGRNRTESYSHNESIPQPNHNNNNNRSTESRNPNDIEGGDNNNDNIPVMVPSITTLLENSGDMLPILSLLNQPAYVDNVMNENILNSSSANAVCDSSSSERGTNSNRTSSSSSSITSSDSKNNTTMPKSLSNVSSYSNQLPNISGLLQNDDTSNIESDELNIPALTMLHLDDNCIPVVVADIITSPPTATPATTNEDLSKNMTNDLIPSLSSLLSLPTLNNNLIEFDYFQLQRATDNFNNSGWLPNNHNSGRLIGSGGFSTVYLGLNLHENIKHAAVKRIIQNQKNIMNGYKYEEKFQMEIDILSQNSHLNLVKLLGYSKNGPEHCLVYELLKDGNLQDKLTRCRENSGTLNWMSRLKIAYGTADAISYLHSVHIIHRDIKSANILLDGDTPKLCDFGFLKSTESNEQSGLWGTSSYVAPEYYHGDYKSPGLDVYSFGVVLLELVSGASVTDRNLNIENLIIYVQANLNNPLLINIIDRKAGLWKYENTITDQNVTSGHYLLDLSIKCLDKKEIRPNIIQIKNNLQKTVEFFCRFN